MKIKEVKTGLSEDKTLHYIDAYFEGNKQKVTVCVYCSDLCKIIVIDSRYMKDTKIKEVLSEIKGKSQPRFPNGFHSWKETYFEIVESITLEIEKKEPTGTVQDRHDAQGMGGLYELADELSTEFETIHEGYEWDGSFFDEMDEFLRIKLYSPKEVYQPAYKK